MWYSKFMMDSTGVWNEAIHLFLRTNICWLIYTTYIRARDFIKKNLILDQRFWSKGLGIFFL